MMRFVYNPEYPNSLFIELTFNSGRKCWASVTYNGIVGSYQDGELNSQSLDVQLSPKETASVLQAIAEHLKEVSNNVGTT